MNELSLLYNYLIVGALLFALGLIGFLVRRNMIVMFLCAEMMLQGVSVSLIGWGRITVDWGGQMLVLFIITVAACEAGIAMALILMLAQRSGKLDSIYWQDLREEGSARLRRSLKCRKIARKIASGRRSPSAGNRARTRPGRTICTAAEFEMSRRRFPPAWFSFPALPLAGGGAGCAAWAEAAARTEPLAGHRRRCVGSFVCSLAARLAKCTTGNIPPAPVPPRKRLSASSKSFRCGPGPMSAMPTN